MALSWAASPPPDERGGIEVAAVWLRVLGRALLQTLVTLAASERRGGERERGR